jgi:hypothetical protein
MLTFMTSACLSPGSFCCRCCWFYQTRELSKKPHFSCMHEKNEKIANGWQSDDLDREDERLLSHQTLILVWELHLSGMRSSFIQRRRSRSWEGSRALGNDDRGALGNQQHLQQAAASDEYLDKRSSVVAIFLSPTSSGMGRMNLGRFDFGFWISCCAFT